VISKGEVAIMRPHAVTKTLAVAAACMVTLAACSSSHKGASPVTSSTTSGTLPSASPNDPGAALQQEFVSVVDKVRPLVVEISTSSGLGSGVVYDEKGDIVTNDHVVGTAKQFQVTFFDGQTVPGTLVGEFPPDDLAVI
jgi:putative serine protease PepD